MNRDDYLYGVRITMGPAGATDKPPAAQILLAAWKNCTCDILLQAPNGVASIAVTRATLLGLRDQLNEIITQFDAINPPN